MLLLVAATVLAACRVDTTVGIELRHDGSGRVRVHVAFDDDARRRVSVSAIKFDDLTAAGWHVSRDGKSVTLEKAFARTADLGPTLRELTGSSPLLRNVSATRTPEFFRTRFAMRVDVDLRELSVGVAGDQDLANRLRLIGLDPSVLEVKLDAPARAAAGMQLVMVMPDGRVRTWSSPAGGRIDARATTSVANGARVTWFVAAVALAGAALLFVVVGLFPRRRRRAHARGGHRDSEAPGEAPVSGERTPEEASP